ncbi:MAG: hypothetical protein A3K18_26815 [Lentisphaerae bacterium RIFOXYA12_64_32]|nr:MAG: hypothetical protein A3K18_26815 [Lentisphaerae bacterium RIFOXYA12_64_32]
MGAVERGDLAVDQFSDDAQQAEQLAAHLYDFRRPHLITREQLRGLTNLHEDFARELQASMSLFLRSAVAVELVSGDQQLYSEFTLSLSEITHAIVFNIGTHVGVAVLEINLSLVLGLVDLLVGGKGNVETSARKPTDVELAILEPLIAMVFARLSASLRNVLPGEIKQLRHESSPEYIQATPPDAPVVVLTFDAKIGMANGIINLCYTMPLVQTIQKELHGKAGKMDYYGKSSQEDVRRHLMSALLETPVRATAELGSTVIRAGDWFTLQPGDILVLEETFSTPVTVSVEGQPMFRGHTGRVGNSLGVKITEVAERPRSEKADKPASP